MWYWPVDHHDQGIKPTCTSTATATATLARINRKKTGNSLTPVSPVMRKVRNRTLLEWYLILLWRSDIRMQQRDSCASRNTCCVRRCPCAKKKWSLKITFFDFGSGLIGLMAKQCGWTLSPTTPTSPLVRSVPIRALKSGRTVWCGVPSRWSAVVSWLRVLGHNEADMRDFSALSSIQID